MNNLETKSYKIDLSKRKITLILLGAIAFVAASIWIWTISYDFPRYNFALKFVAISGVGFFGMIAIVGSPKLLNKKPGILLSENGIFDNSAAFGSVTIKWNDIVGYEITEIKGTRLLLVFVNNPEYYINSAHWFRKFWIKANFKLYKTPLSISSSALKCDLDELVEKIMIFSEKYAQKIEFFNNEEP